MESNTNSTIKFIILFLPAFVLCIIFSFIFYQPEVAVFDFRSSVLQFILEGLLGIILFSCLETLSLRTALIIFILLSLFGQPYISLPADLSLYVRKLLFNAVTGISIYLYWLYSSGEKIIFRNRPLLLAGYLGLAYLIADGGWHFIYNAVFSKTILGFLNRGFISGLALGLGFEIGKYLLHRKMKPAGINNEVQTVER